MNSLVVYYSFSGNTRQVARILQEYLAADGSCQLAELQPLDEPRSFFRRGQRAFWRRRAVLAPTVTDLAGFDQICLGTPVWAFGPAPAMTAYLDLCTGLAGKPVTLFTTHGGGLGNGRCLEYLRRQCAAQSAGSIRAFSISQFKAGDREFILTAIRKAFQQGAAA